ncbi:hypothetical protein FNF28_04196 [Cafeteria roenbergensis]|uniref:NAD-dependent epimerase/dehydratase domain-containing protein n=1 Tax=Cafeteria roenbergensis TaxID=33653 RepID=A0A5A8DEY4_CAFRO|nr:hypothetical protein FNF28_04196 [Cafeteria roenbergensis]
MLQKLPAASSRFDLLRQPPPRQVFQSAMAATAPIQVGTAAPAPVPLPKGFSSLTPEQQGYVMAARLGAAVTSATNAKLADLPFGVGDLTELDIPALATDAADAPAPKALQHSRRRVLVTDLDGTLTGSSGRLPASVFARLETLRERQNVLVVVCTGRPVSWARTIMATWPVDAVVAENGAVILFAAAPEGASAAAGPAGSSAGAPPTVVEEALFPSTEEDLAARAAMIKRATDAPSAGGLGLSLSPDQAGRACDVAFELDDSPAAGPTRGIPAAFLEELTAGGFAFSFSNIHLNVWRGSQTKASGSDAVLARLGLSAEDAADAVFVGDSPNDRPCFRRFHPHSYGVASVSRYTGVAARGPAAEDAAETGPLSAACGRVTVSDGPAGWLEAVDHAFPSQAFATLVANEFYVTGAIALAKSLAATGTTRPLICLTGPEVPEESAARLAALGVVVARVPLVPFTDAFRERHRLDVIKASRPYNSGVDKPKQFRNLFNFSKLLLWALTDFETVVYLDADIVVMQSMDSLFDVRGFGAAHNLHVRFDQLNRINSGVMVLHPSVATLRAMFRVLLDEASTVTYHRTDQTFLESFFAGRTHGLDRSVNALQYFFVTAPEAWDWATVRATHFIMQKPWQSLADAADADAAAALVAPGAPLPALPSGARPELACVHAVWWAVFRATLASDATVSAHDAVVAAGEAAVASLVSTDADADAAETKDDEVVPAVAASATSAASAAAAAAGSATPAAATGAAAEALMLSKAAAGATAMPLTLLAPRSKRVLVVGGDGFCGWPLALRLSAQGYEVLIADNLSRRRIDAELGVDSLTPIKPMAARLAAWEEVTRADGGAPRKIHFELCDVNTEYDRFKGVMERFRPSTVVHLGEQRAAPYSMKDERTRRYTVTNNLGATHAVLNAIGYVDIKMKDMHGKWQDKSILHPAYPGSVYHMTKTQDALFFQFYAKNYGLSITDLHQGIVWGLHTDETRRHPDLINRLDYDGDYGTVLNRFVMQSACGHPLTVYGTGEQTRAFIHIQNSMECMQLAVENPPKRGDAVRIFNQMTECHRLLDLVALLKRVFPGTEASFVDNPRKELRANDLRVTNQKFLDLGLKPRLLEGDSVREIHEAVTLFKSRFDPRHVLPKSFW